MKRTLQFLCLVAGFNSLSAQTTDEAKTHYYYQRFATAEQVLHRSLAQRPEDGKAWLLLAQCYLSTKKYKQLLDSITLAPASLVEDPYYLIAKGGVSLVKNKIDSGRLYFDQAIDITKGKNSDVLANIATTQIIAENGDMNYALEVLQKAMKREKNDAWLYVLMGNAYYKLHNGGEAFKAYRQAIEKDKKLAEPYYKLGEIFQSQKNESLYLDYFNQAVAADPNYAPAYAELYSYYVYTKPDPAKAMEYFNKYSSSSEPSIKLDYAYTDLLYLNKDFQKAIAKARELVSREKEKVQPRIYKLLGYSYAELKDTSQAIDQMRHYFNYQVDSNIIPKDYEAMAAFYLAQTGSIDSAITYYAKAAHITSDSSILFQYYKDLANLSARNKDYDAQAKWMGLYYQGNDRVSNVDLFNWGIAAFRAANYSLSDSVFGIYTGKYPDQGFGYYWRARSNAAIDTSMSDGLAIPHYTRIIEMINKDSASATEKKWMIEAYNYLAAYETNTKKDYDKGLEYFERVLEIDPENVNAKKYIPILEANKEKVEANN